MKLDFFDAVAGLGAAGSRQPRMDLATAENNEDIRFRRPFKISKDAPIPLLGHFSRQPMLCGQPV